MAEQLSRQQDETLDEWIQRLRLPDPKQPPPKDKMGYYEGIHWFIEDSHFEPTTDPATRGPLPRI